MERVELHAMFSGAIHGGDFASEMAQAQAAYDRAIRYWLNAKIVDPSTTTQHGLNQVKMHLRKAIRAIEGMHFSVGSFDPKDGEPTQ